LVTQSLSNVPLARAADASGVLTTTMQLGQVGGVAAFGTLFLSLRPQLTDATALTTTGWALALVATAGVVASTFLARHVRQV
jgi:hypothetical protein